MGPLEARVVADESGDPVVSWTPLTSDVATHRFEGAIPAVPTGGWYRIEVRSSTEKGARLVGEETFAVGALVACAGQSQIALWFSKGKEAPRDDDPVPDPLVRMYRHDSYWWNPPGSGKWRPVSGKAAIVFANELRKALEIPIGLLPYPVNGSALWRSNALGSFPAKNGSPPTLGWWIDDDGVPRPRHNHTYALVEALEATGGAEALLWVQGHTDGMKGDSAEHYAGGVAQVVEVLRKASRDDLPVFVSLLPRETAVAGYPDAPSMTDEAALAIRAGQRAAVASDDRMHLAATTIDLPLSEDHVHISVEGRNEHARRMAHAVAAVLTGRSDTDFRGPSLRAFEIVDDEHVDVHIQHRSGDDLVPTTAIDGFTVEGERAGDVVEANRLDGDTIRLRVSGDARAITGVSYLMSGNPADLDVEAFAESFVHDDSPLALPLEAGTLSAKPAVP